MSANLLFNNFIQSNVLYALNNLGVLAHLHSIGAASFEELKNKLNLVDERLNQLLKIAEIFGLVKKKFEKYSLSRRGEDLFQQIGFFTWAIGGYGQLFQSLDKLCKSEDRKISNLIDGHNVAKGSDECYQGLMRSILQESLQTVPFSSVADLGCGNAGKLIQYAKENPNFRGIGIDINPQAIQLARQNVRDSGLENQIQLTCANLLDAISSDLVFPEVETVTCFMMLHDIFNISKPNHKIFKKLRKAFPNVSHFVIGDTVASSKYSDQSDLPIFTLGFELIHGLMDIKLFNLNHYLNVFEKAKLTLEKTIPFGVPNTYLFILKND